MGGQVVQTPPGIARLLIFAMLKFSVRHLLGIWSPPPPPPPLRKFAGSAHDISMQHCYLQLYINPANHAPGVKNGPTPGVNSSQRLTIGKKNMKISSTKPHGPELSYFIMEQCIVLLFINPANSAPGVHTGHAPGMPFSTIDLKWKYIKKISSLQLHDTKLVYLICNNVMWSST